MGYFCSELFRDYGKDIKNIMGLQTTGADSSETIHRREVGGKWV